MAAKPSKTQLQTEEAINASSPIVRVGFTFFGVLFFVCALFVGYYSVLLAIRANASSSWPTVPGKIIESRMETDAERKGGGYRQVIKYQYQVHGRDLVGSCVAFYANPSQARSGAEAIVARYPLHSQVTVYYDPEHNEEAVLEPGTPWWSYFLLLVPILLLGSGIRCFTVLRDIRKGSADPQAKHKP